MVANLFSKANNPEVEGYDPQKPTSYIQLVDCNNQYGFELGALDTESPEFWANFVTTQRDEQQDGFLFEVELEYPTYLHDKLDNFPLAPVHQEIK